MEQAMREEFEAWWSSPTQSELRKSCARGWAEVIWQASRAALRVELPDVPDFRISAEESLDMEPEVYESLETIHCAEVAMLNRCKRALQQAGIEVK
ncbi:hypothetical protein [Pseudomonas aeruginosa]